jgi:hypothetical protein
LSSIKEINIIMPTPLHPEQILGLVKQTDPAMYTVLLKEFDRQQNTLEMIASENFTSVAVMEAMGFPVSAITAAASLWMRQRTWPLIGPSSSLGVITSTFSLTAALRPIWRLFWQQDSNPEIPFWE